MVSAWPFTRNSEFYNSVKMVSIRLLDLICSFWGRCGSPPVLHVFVLTSYSPRFRDVPGCKRMSFQLHQSCCTYLLKSTPSLVTVIEGLLYSVCYQLCVQLRLLGSFQTGLLHPCLDQVLDTSGFVVQYDVPFHLNFAGLKSSIHCYPKELTPFGKE